MTWLTILRLVLQVAARLTEIARDKRLIEAGEAQANLAALTEQQGRVASAMKIRRKVAQSQKEFPDRIRDNDGFKRD